MPPLSSVASLDERGAPLRGGEVGLDVGVLEVYADDAVPVGAELRAVALPMPDADPVTR